jgi:hypothetical protein
LCHPRRDLAEQDAADDAEDDPEAQVALEETLHLAGCGAWFTGAVAKGYVAHVDRAAVVNRSSGPTDYYVSINIKT